MSKYYYPEAQAAYYQRNKDKIKARRAGKRYNMSRLYGIDNDDYDTILVKQDSKCAICLKPAEENTHGRLYVDHCHDSKKVRGLLCNSCNTGIGQFKDDKELLKAAIRYLDEKVSD